jgi:hypothetical protein
LPLRNYYANNENYVVQLLRIGGSDMFSADGEFEPDFWFESRKLA